jgi:hypothetical protein
MTVAVAVKGLVGEQNATDAFGAVAITSAAARAGDPPAGTVPRRGSPSPSSSAGPRDLSTSPTRIQIPSLNVVATIVSVATVGGRLTVPEDPRTVGWWAGAALPGSRSGTVVLDGHVDSATRGTGAFFRLTALRAGDVVTVTTVGGDRVTYQVVARRSYSKAAGLPVDVFSRNGPSRLALITCGGSFDPAALRYRDNVVVFATPTNPSSLRQ